MKTVFDGKYRKPAWYEICVASLLLLLLVQPEQLFDFAMIIMLLAFVGHVTLILPNLSPNENILDHRSAFHILSPQKDSEGRIRVPVLHMWMLQAPLLNFLFGKVSLGTVYITDRRLYFQRSRMGFLNKGKSFSIDLSAVGQATAARFTAGTDLSNYVVKFSRERISRADAEVILDTAGLVPFVGWATYAAKTLPHLIILPARLMGTGFSVIEAQGTEYVFWIRKPEAIQGMISRYHQYKGQADIADVGLRHVVDPGAASRSHHI